MNKIFKLNERHFERLSVKGKTFLFSVVVVVVVVVVVCFQFDIYAC